jgi:hypothetical protein
MASIRVMVQLGLALTEAGLGVVGGEVVAVALGVSAEGAQQAFHLAQYPLRDCLASPRRRVWLIAMHQRFICLAKTRSALGIRHRSPAARISFTAPCSVRLTSRKSTQLTG